MYRNPWATCSWLSVASSSRPGPSLPPCNHRKRGKQAEAYEISWMLSDAVYLPSLWLRCRTRVPDRLLQEGTLAQESRDALTEHTESLTDPGRRIMWTPSSRLHQGTYWVVSNPSVHQLHTQVGNLLSRCYHTGPGRPLHISCISSSTGTYQHDNKLACISSLSCPPHSSWLQKGSVSIACAQRRCLCCRRF